MASIPAIAQRQEIRKHFATLYDEIRKCPNCRDNHKLKNTYAWLIERVLYKPRKND